MAFIKQPRLENLCWQTKVRLCLYGTKTVLKRVGKLLSLLLLFIATSSFPVQLVSSFNNNGPKFIKDLFSGNGVNLCAPKFNLKFFEDVIYFHQYEALEKSAKCET